MTRSEKHFPESPKVKLFAAIPGAIMLLGPFLENWLATEKQNTRGSTWRGYRKIVHGHLIPGFGELCLADLRRRHVKDWAAQHPMSPKTLTNVISPLRIALADAFDSELIEDNPLAGWKISRRRNPAGKAKKFEADPFSLEEREAILHILDGQGFNFVQFAFWTGLRTSELCALDWPDIDWLRGVVRVSRALTQGSEEPEEGTKTQPNRDVKLLPPALEVLKAQKAFTFLKGEEIFQNPRTGERWAGDQPIRKTMWTPALKRAGVRYRKPYQTRHTYASMLLMSGENVMWVAKQMGHKDWAFTARTYARWIPDDAPEAGNRAVAKFAQMAHNGGK